MSPDDPPGRRRRVYVAYTGGTVGMRRDARGYRPQAGYLSELLRGPAFSDAALPELEVAEYDPLLDSADMRPQDWNRIATDLAAHYSENDGFVVLHGTDTMAYTASALSFMLEGLAKPVVVTGSQIPLSESRSDARQNLVTALLLAAGAAVPEVCLFFSGKLLRGNRSVKVDATGLDAFASPNHPPLGVAGVDLRIEYERVLAPEPGPLRVRTLNGERKVAALRLFPGISTRVLRNLLREPLAGLVLECYGAGNAPLHHPGLLDAIREASARGVVIVDVTQCLRGRVLIGAYATSSALADAGVVSGHDMTAEAALTKLLYLLSRESDPERVRTAMQRSLRGELTT